LYGVLLAKILGENANDLFKGFGKIVGRAKSAGLADLIDRQCVFEQKLFGAEITGAHLHDPRSRGEKFVPIS
jgi:hypothetical protein